jgi:hypothetical protein
MLRRILALTVSALLCVSTLSGCGNDSGGGAEEVEVKTAEQHKADAEKEITEENMEDELAKIEKEMAQETE